MNEEINSEWFDPLLRQMSGTVRWDRRGFARACAILRAISILNGGQLFDDTAISRLARQRFALRRAADVLQKFRAVYSLRTVSQDGTLSVLAAIRKELLQNRFPAYRFTSLTRASVVKELDAAARRVRATKRRSAAEGTAGLIIDRTYAAMARALITNARTSVYVAMFYIRYGPSKRYPTRSLIDALIGARRRGADVKVIVDQDREGEVYASKRINATTVRQLRRAGIDVVFDSPQIVTHSKLLIVDNTRVVVGSHNWTGGSLRAYDDVSVYVESRALGQRYGREFLRRFRAHALLT